MVDLAIPPGEEIPGDDDSEEEESFGPIYRQFIREYYEKVRFAPTAVVVRLANAHFDKARPEAFHRYVLGLALPALTEEARKATNYTHRLRLSGRHSPIKEGRKAPTPTRSIFSTWLEHNGLEKGKLLHFKKRDLLAAAAAREKRARTDLVTIAILRGFAAGMDEEQELGQRYTLPELDTLARAIAEEHGDSLAETIEGRVEWAVVEPDEPGEPKTTEEEGEVA